MHRIALVSFVFVAAACPSQEGPVDPVLSVVAEGAPVSFGSVLVGARKTETVRLVNAGSAPVRVSALGSGTEFWSVFAHTLSPTLLEPAQTLSFDVSFAPQAPGDASAVLTVLLQHQTEKDQLVIPIGGIGQPVPCGLEPAQVEFGSVAVSGFVRSRPRLLNTSPVPWRVRIEGIEAEASSAEAFMLVHPAPGTYIVPEAEDGVPGSLELIVRFSPKRSGEHRAHLVVMHEGACDDRVELKGFGSIDGTIEERFPSACVPTECADAFEVATLQDLFVAAALEWEPLYTAGGTCLNASRDLVATAPITVRISDIPVPQWCLDSTDCRDQPELGIDPEIPGVQFLAADGVERMEDEVQLQPGAVVRLRAVVRDTHPSASNYTPSLRFLDSCHAPCRADQIRCAASHTCWDTTSQYCAYCLSGPAWICGCFDGTRSLDDGTSCSWRPSGDTSCSGQCKDGWCDSPSPECVVR